MCCRVSGRWHDFQNLADEEIGPYYKIDEMNKCMPFPQRGESTFFHTKYCVYGFGGTHWHLYTLIRCNRKSPFPYHHPRRRRHLEVTTDICPTTLQPPQSFVATSRDRTARGCHRSCDVRQAYMKLKLGQKIRL